MTSMLLCAFMCFYVLLQKAKQKMCVNNETCNKINLDGVPEAFYGFSFLFMDSRRYEVSYNMCKGLSGPKYDI